MSTLSGWWSEQSIPNHSALIPPIQTVTLRSDDIDVNREVEVKGPFTPRRERFTDSMPRGICLV